ncbi:PAS domain-containing hybrid sensor histidine kinase/response regulator [Marinomonas transparens]|uniref:Sensory/regulatory protein RpfC n=1 Tax=Marinomonas transparens TaxID=2795388 RepID=A0A934JLW1_9GAMM|nr:PAS domain S-box protein [Marinomonas transparens]MBJ7538575.1 PAS domain S-box protein [Marinomonas transparens]
MSGKFSKNIFHPLVFFTLLISLSLTAFVTNIVYQSNTMRIAKATEHASKNAMQAVISRIQLYKYGLKGARGAILMAGEHDIDRATFQRYGSALNIDTAFPGAKGFGFVRRVSQVNEEGFVDITRKSGWPLFTIKELSPNIGERYVIQYVEPIARNEQSIGLDIASEKKRRDAARAALESGETRLSAPILEEQSTGKLEQFFVIFLPIYRGDVVPSLLEERLEMGFGWSYAPLSMDGVLADLEIDTSRQHFELFDITDSEEGERFYTKGQLITRVFEHAEEYSIFGRKWRGGVAVSPLFIEDLNLPSIYKIAATGVLISFLVTFLLGAIRVNITRRREVETQQSMITAVVESSADGIISKTLDGKITSWNRGAERLLGFSKEEAIGKTVMELLVPDSLRYEEERVLASLKNKTAIMPFETWRKTKSGAEIAVAVSVSPIINHLGQVVGASKSVRDISHQKEAEAKIRELNTSLEKQVRERTTELRESNLLLNNVLDSSSEIAIVATDLNGIIKLFNSGAERMLGYSSEEAIGKLTPLDFHLQSEVEARHKELQAETGRRVPEGLATLSYKAYKNDYDRQEWSYVAKNGEIIPVSLVITTMKDSSGEMVGVLGMAQDISEQKASQQALISARDQLLMAAQVAQLGIWHLDLTSHTLEWSDTLFEIYHYPLSLREEGITYEHWYNRVHPEDRESAISALNNAIKGVEEYDRVIRIVLPDDSVRYLKSGAFVERDENGKALKVTGINRDITDERNLETWLRKAKDEADAASAAKSDFLANMSHEIRTPMNAVLGMLHLVLRTNLSNQQHDYISKAQIAAKSLLNLINDILDFSKVDAGKLELDHAPFELEELLFELSTVLSGTNRDNGVELVFDIDKDIPPFLIGDQMRLLQILINLSSNALKFTLEGVVTLEVKCLATKGNVARLAVAVRDTGIGISEDQREHIFDVFSQAESSTARRFGGSGLGLVICRRFVELMGGELLVESVVGEGSCFHFTIELPIAEMTQQKQLIDTQTRRSIRILVVESNRVSQAMFLRMIRTLGWTGVTAETGQQAVDLILASQANEEAFDAILLDAHMPNFEGLDGVAFLHAQLAEGSCPKIIMLTNNPNDRLNNSNETGLFSDYLLKPVTLSQLSESVYQAVSDGKEFVAQLADGVCAKRLAGVNILLIEDNAFNRQVADELLTAEGATVTLAEGGIEGVEKVCEQQEGTFDLVLMDMQMPDIDGLEATRRIRKDKRFLPLPIIAMTANVSNLDRQRCLDAGMNDHLGKPLDLELMVKCIQSYVKVVQTETTIESESQKPPVQEVLEHGDKALTTGSKVEEIHSILDRFGGSTDLLTSLVDGFALESKNLLDSINKGAKQKDKALTLEGLHTLKGSCLTMGLTGLSKRLLSFEQGLIASEDQALIEDCLATIDTVELSAQVEEELAIIMAALAEVS